MIDITILHWRISPYFICFLLSFVLAYLYVTWYLKKAGVRGSHIFYSELLNTVLALYFGAFYTFIVQLAEQGKVETFGFSSLGGMAGILLGVWIFTKIRDLAVSAILIMEQRGNTFFRSSWQRRSYFCWRFCCFTGWQNEEGMV